MEIQKYHQPTDGRTDGHLRWVGARDTCVSKNITYEKHYGINQNMCEEKEKLGVQ